MYTQVAVKNSKTTWVQFASRLRYQVDKSGKDYSKHDHLP